MLEKKLTYPQMGNYSVPIYYLLRHIFNVKIIKPNKITNHTIELGSKYSPNFVCMPFKYTLATFIEGLEKGANILLQAGGGCRYGYYSELQEEILKNLGYDFTYINLVSKGKSNKIDLLKKIKKIDKKINIFKVLYYLFITKKMVQYMDELEDNIRQNKAFEVNKGEFDKVYNELLTLFGNTTCYVNLFKNYIKYKNRIKNIEVNKPINHLKIGIIGELYTLMEPFANYNLENLLYSYGVEVKRFTNVTYLLFKKKKAVTKFMKKMKNYIRYKLGADAHDNIYRTKYLCDNNYDGIIHIKSSFCTPEIGAIPIINKICKEYDMPIIYFSFDANTSMVGIETRIEAFIDMLNMKKG